MVYRRQRSFVSRALSRSASIAFQQAYRQVRVDPEKYLKQVRRKHRLPVQSWKEMFYLGPEVITPIADRTIAGASKAAALEGVGLGVGGFMTVIPDLGILATITLRMLQRLSLLHGFEYTSAEEDSEFMWVAASAAGVDLGRDFLEKQAIERLGPKLVDMIAAKVGVEIAEKWAGRIIPVVSAGAAGAINYYFVRAWGRRARKHLLARHRAAAGYPAPFDLRSSAPGPVLASRAALPESS